MLRRLLIVDDDADVRFAVRQFLEIKGYKVAEAESCAAAEVAFRGLRPDAVLLDYSLPDGDALGLLPKLKEAGPNVPIILLTAHASIDLAVSAVKLGAENFVTKPVQLPALLVIVERSLENERCRRRNLAADSRTARREINPFIGTSTAIQRLEEQARRIADSEHPVLLLGETGTGKGVLASWLHATGPRRAETFVDLNCAALARELIETELFGNERGAFTGAVEQKQGLLEFADHGTVFLDEIGDMDLQAQAKILKVIEEKRFRRVGDVRDRSIDVRVIAATHQDLALQQSQKTFRSDLYYRISTFPLTLPALRDRRDDIPALASTFISTSAHEMGRNITLSEAALMALQSYTWPGNIRELRNVIERALLLTTSNVIEPKDLLLSHATPQESSVDVMTLPELEAAHIRHVLAQEGGHVDRAAKRLGIHRATLYQKIKTLGL
jgi:DNA-binding NtrC family response regulator